MIIISNNIELKAKVTKKLFYNSESSWGAFSFKPLEATNKVKLNQYENFVVSGNVQELFIDREYDLIITPSKHPKYGDGYTFVLVKEKKPETVSEQHAYIRAMLRESLAEEIIKRYPNEDILTLMKEDKFDYQSIHGMGEKTYQKTKNFLLLNLDIQEAMIELADLNITFKAMKKLIEHFGSASVVIEKVKENIYILCDAPGFGFLKVDSYALNRGDAKDNPNRIIAAIEYILEQEESNGHCWISEEILLKKAEELLKIDNKLIKERLNEEHGKKNSKLFFGENAIGLYKNYFYESKIKEKLIELQESKNKFSVSNIDERIFQVEKEMGVQYTDEQKEAIRLAVENQVFILNGRGGSGKTTTLRGILGVLKKYTHACCALSGKASKVMASLGLNGMTIHRMLGGGVENQFEYNHNNPLPYDIIVLDEASMCSNFIMYSVITAVRNGSKLIILGDSGQLASIGAGAVFDDLVKSKKFPIKELKTIHRQAEKSGVLSIANQIRDGKQIINKGDYERKVFGELKDLIIFPVEDRTQIKDMVLRICQNYKDKNNDISDFQVITGLKNRGDISVKNLNIELQKIFNDISKPFVKRGGYEYREGDIVIQCGNNYTAGEEENISIFNGTMGKIVNIEFLKGNGHKIYIDFDGIDETICYTTEELDQIELGYAISVHKSQGSTIKNVVFVFDYTSYMLLSKQFIYTGLTRTSNKCIMICELEALRHGIRIDHGNSRCTFLYDLLIN